MNVVEVVVVVLNTLSVNAIIQYHQMVVDIALVRENVCQLVMLR